jgi:hypothetical protein
VRLRHLRIECPTESAAAGESFDTHGTSIIEGGIANIAAAIRVDSWSSSISAVSAPYRGAPDAAKQQEP